MDVTELFTYLFLVLSGLIVGYWLFSVSYTHLTLPTTPYV